MARLEEVRKDILDSPCIFCGYNGRGYWQPHTHNKLCPWYALGGEVERRNYLLSTKKICQLFEQPPDEGRLLVSDIHNPFSHLPRLKNPLSAGYIDVGEVYAEGCYDQFEEDAKTTSIKEAEFLQWLEKQGNQQQVELFKREGIL